MNPKKRKRKSDFVRFEKVRQNIDCDLILFTSAKNITVLNGNDILYMLASNKCTDIFFTGNLKYTILKSLKISCEFFKKYVTCNGCSLAINLNAVRNFDKYTSSLTFKDGTVIILKPNQAEEIPRILSENFRSIC